MRICSVCHTESAVYKQKFRPYSDVEWSFDVYDCTDCEARFVLRDPGVNYHEALYANYATYQSYFQKSEVVKAFLSDGKLRNCGFFLKQWSQYKAIINFVAEHDKSKSLRILEVGSSTGFLTAFLRAKGHQVLGVDISEKAVSEANRVFGPYFSTNIPAGGFDLVVSCGTIGCIDEPLMFLKEIRGLLNQGGYFFCNAPNLKSLNKKQLWASTPPPDLITMFTANTFNRLATLLGMEFTYTEELSNTLITTQYPLTFGAKPSKVSQYKLKYPMLFALVARAKSSLQMLVDKFARTKTLGQYGLMVTLQKGKL